MCSEGFRALQKIQRLSLAKRGKTFENLHLLIKLDCTGLCVIDENFTDTHFYCV